MNFPAAFACTFWRYALAAVSVAASLMATYLLQPYLLRTPLFFLAIMVSTWVGGRAPGLLAVVLSAASIGFIVDPEGIAATRFHGVPNLAAFLMSAFLVSSWSATRKRAEDALRQARNDLDARVKDRTEELERANRRLQEHANFFAGEKRIFEMLTQGDCLPQILDALCRLVEDQSPGVLASILLLEGNRLRHGAAPSLPKAYTDAIDGSMIGPEAGSCGTAAFRGQQVVVADIDADPLWREYRAVALPHALRACWSTPVFSSEGHVIATFAMYYRQPCSPGPGDQEIIEQITHLAGVAIQRKQTEEQLRRSEAHLRQQASLLEQSHDAVFVWEFAGPIVYWNRGAEQLYGYSREEALGRRSHELLRTEHPMSTDVFEGVIDRQGAWSGELTQLTRDGHTILVDSRQMLISEDGHRLVLETNRDITERKRTEAERERLRQSEANLAHINRVTTMSELASSLAHEIRQPISATILDAQTCLRWLQRERPAITEACEAASRAVTAATRTADIISRIRSLFNKDTRKSELVDVNEVIRETTLLLRSEASQFSIAIDTTLAPHVPFVRADRIQLQQVIMNLVVNGIDAMKTISSPGHLTITSQVIDRELLISVSDTGIGLPPVRADHVFQPFFTTKRDGAGMGLTISRSIVESHGGRVWASPNAERGATFSFTLPTEGKSLELTSSYRFT
jgi:PAS domain S-box-containing protein